MKHLISSNCTFWLYESKKNAEVKSPLISWAIAKKIFKDGFKPRNIYSKEIPKLMEDLKGK
ncbi:hypothetical protein CCY01nite_09400 [Chitinophaga cymbidii]|uniref:Uncharacterized protein n=1 Tax=Chitinophaga cymbidii TaxID=1096750 RepID=A0A512RG61_9BACT|nr:hypothetical protein CCY01nite_09400 [Chitinophaga cymbidii]